jgi:hypothetical protein
MCACNTAQPFDLRPLSSWQGGFTHPPLASPRSRSVAPWTSPDALRLLDFRPGRFHQPPDPRPWVPSCPPWTPRPREPSALPLDTHRAGRVPPLAPLACRHYFPALPSPEACRP